MQLLPDTPDIITGLDQSPEHGQLGFRPAARLVYVLLGYQELSTIILITTDWRSHLAFAFSPSSTKRRMASDSVGVSG